MRGGKLSTRVVIERARQTRNRLGEVLTPSWEVVSTVWAGERTTAAAERLAGGQLVAEVDSVFEVRAWPGPAVIGPEERFRVVTGRKLGETEGGLAHNVLGVLKLPQRGAGHMLLCRARAETTPGDQGPAPTP